MHVPIVLKSGSLNLLEPSGPVKGCNGIDLPLPYTSRQAGYNKSHWTVHLDGTTGRYNWTVHLDGTTGRYNWTVHLDGTTGRYIWTVHLDGTTGRYNWTVQ